MGIKSKQTMMYSIQFYLLFICAIQTGRNSSTEHPSDLVLADLNQIPVERLDCFVKGIELKGKVKIVEHFADLKIQYVDHFPDLKVKFVDHFPDDCGEWQLVDHFPDFTIEIVDHFPDLKVEKVDQFPGFGD